MTADKERAVSASGDRTLKVFDLASGRELRTLEGHSADVWGVSVTPDGKRAVSASLDKTMKMWDLESGRELTTLKGHSDGVSAVAVTPYPERAVSASFDQTLKTWDLESGYNLSTLKGHGSYVRHRRSNGRRKSGSFRVRGQNAEGVGPGNPQRASRVARPFFFCHLA